MKRRNLILLVGGTSVGGLIFGSGAFSSTTAVRGMNVDVVPDGEALVGYEVRADVEPEDTESDAEFPEFVVTAGKKEERTLVTVTNRLGENTTLEIVDVDVTTQNNEKLTVSDVEWDGESFNSTADIRGTVVCDEAGSDVVELTVMVEATGINATLSGDTDTRRFVIRCEPESPPDLTNEFLPGGSEEVNFDGLGQVELKHDQSGTVDVQFYVGDETGANKQMSVNARSSETVETNQKVGGDRFSNESVVGVRIGDSDAIYLHPSWEQSDCEFDNGSGGTVSTPASIEDTDPTECSSS